MGRWAAGLDLVGSSSTALVKGGMKFGYVPRVGGLFRGGMWQGFGLILDAFVRTPERTVCSGLSGLIMGTADCGNWEIGAYISFRCESIRWATHVACVCTVCMSRICGFLPGWMESGSNWIDYAPSRVPGGKTVFIKYVDMQEGSPFLGGCFAWFIVKHIVTCTCCTWGSGKADAVEAQDDMGRPPERKPSISLLLGFYSSLAYKNCLDSWKA